MYFYLLLFISCKCFTPYNFNNKNYFNIKDRERFDIRDHIHNRERFKNDFKHEYNSISSNKDNLYSKEHLSDSEFLNNRYDSLNNYYNTGVRPVLNLRIKQVANNNKNLSDSLFPVLDNYQLGARPAAQSKYPWLARVVHSTKEIYPHMCTASCIHRRIFITSARCALGLKVYITSVIYKDHRFPVTAVVLPSEHTKQYFEDIGLIVVNPGGFDEWSTIKITTKKRSGSDYSWFDTMNLVNVKHTVVGYAAKKDLHKLPIPDMAFDLYELEVFVDPRLCSEILTANVSFGFHVPCFSYCSLATLKKSLNAANCQKYLGVEGGAVLNTKTTELLGVSTWAGYAIYTKDKYELPVGFAVPNSASFLSDYNCAKKIANDVSANVRVGYYQDLCDTI